MTLPVGDVTFNDGYRRGRSDLANLVRNLADRANERLSDEHADRQLLLEDLIEDIRRATS